MPEKKLPVAASAEALLAATGTPTKEISIPEWGVTVEIRGMTRGEVRALTDAEPAELEARAVAACLVNPTITVEQARDLLENKSFGATQILLNRIMEVSGLSEGFLTE